MEILNNIMNSIISFYHFIIDNITVDWIIKFAILYFFIIWWAFVIWVVKDITNRTTNIFVQFISIVLVIILTPIFWLPIYLLIRPRNTIFEKYYEEADLEEDEEEVVLEEEVEEVKEYSCPKCGKLIKEDFYFCPYCEFELIKSCTKCEKSLKSEWKVCPFCWEKQEKNTVKAEKKDAIKVEVEKVKKTKKTDILSEIEDNKEDN